MADSVLGSAGAGNPPPGAPAPGATGAADWTTGFDEATRGFVQTKGWKSQADAVGSYINLEKLMGADKAGRGIVIPKDDAGADEWGGFYGKLGRPADAAGYGLKAPDGDTGEFVKVASGWFHEAGLSSKQAQGLAGKWNEYQTAAKAKADETFGQQAELDERALRAEWGDQFEAQAELARRARRESGLTDAEGQAIERALGLGKAARVFAKLGKQFAEAPMRDGNGAGGGSFAVTPEAARTRIQALRQDTVWSQRYLNGDAEARGEFDRLHKIAFG